MGVKYVKDFSFPSSGGFHGDVQRYAKGGHVTKMPAKAKASAKDMPARAKPNAPAKGAPKMASKPAVGKRQGYDKGGRVPGREMDRLPTKRPPGRMKDLAPARRFKGAYEGYAEGGPVDEILPGDGRGGLDAVPPLPPDDPRLLPSLPPGYEPPPLAGDDGKSVDFLRQLLERDTQRMRGDAAQQMRDMQQLGIGTAGGRGPEGDNTDYGYAKDNFVGILPTMPPEELPEFLRPELQQTPVRATTPLPEEPQYLEPLPRPDVFGRSGLNRGPAAFELPAPRTRDDIMADRREMVGARGALRAADEPMIRRAVVARDDVPRMGIPRLAPAVMQYKKGGEVKGKSKIGKVMGEYKRGELHSGSKKGPKVTSEKQAMAIALSEARKAGAKIPKKAEGGIFNDEYMAYQSKGPKTRGTARKGREQGRRERRAREAMEHAEMYAPGKSLDMADRKNRGGMPVHRRKPMYGGGKC